MLNWRMTCENWSYRNLVTQDHPSNHPSDFTCTTFIFEYVKLTAIYSLGWKVRLWYIGPSIFHSYSRSVFDHCFKLQCNDSVSKIFENAFLAQLTKSHLEHSKSVWHSRGRRKKFTEEHKNWRHAHNTPKAHTRVSLWALHTSALSFLFHIT